MAGTAIAIPIPYTGPGVFFGGRTFDLVFSQTVALCMRDYALSRDSAYCLPTFQLE